MDNDDYKLPIPQPAHTNNGKLESKEGDNCKIIGNHSTWVNFRCELKDILNEQRVWCTVVNPETFLVFLKADVERYDFAQKVLCLDRTVTTSIKEDDDIRVIRKINEDENKTYIHLAISFAIGQLTDLVNKLLIDIPPPIESDINNKDNCDYEGVVGASLERSTSTVAAPYTYHKVLFIDKVKADMFASCTSVHHRPVIVSLTEISDDRCYTADDEVTRAILKHYFLHFIASHHNNNNNNKSVPSDEDHRHTIPVTPPAPHLISALLSFLKGATANTWPKALQGCPHGTMGFRPDPNLHLSAALQVREGTFKRLVYDTCCDVLTVIYSPRCPCCPEILLLIDNIVCALNNLRIKLPHEPEEDPKWITNSCNIENGVVASVSSGRGGCDSVPCVGPVSYDASTGHLLARLVYCIVNIDEDDLSQVDWPSESHGQIVPHIRMYTANISSEYIFANGGGVDKPSTTCDTESTAFNNSNINKSSDSSLEKGGQGCSSSAPSEGRLESSNLVNSDIAVNYQNTIKKPVVFEDERTVRNITQFIVNNVRWTQFKHDVVSIVERTIKYPAKRMREVDDE
eukprot:Tbor_TRINITY_DN5899_c4_g3::TRINITY_DN5899_c4_g3_i1::g.6570::m.6570